MILYRNYLDYFQKIAEEIKLISDFHQYDILDFSEKQNRHELDETGYILFLEAYESQIKKVNLDHLRHLKTGSFMLLKKISAITQNTLKTPAEAKGEILSESEEISLQIVAKMKEDKTTPNFCFMRGLEIENFQFFKVGPVLNNFYGWRVELEFHDPIRLSIDKKMWN